MILILFRHGHAVEPEDFLGKSDAERPLIQKGKDRTKLMAKVLKKLNIEFDMIVHSPFLRAKETAQILIEHLQITNHFESKDLIPSATSQSFIEWLRIHADESQAVLAVGHEPHLSGLASYCLSGEKNHFIELKKAGAIAIQFPDYKNISPGSAELLWHISPKLFE